MDKPTFTFDRLVGYTPDAVLEELRRVARLIHPLALNRDALKRHGRVGISTARRHFGTWRRALADAGIAHTLDSARPVTPKMTQQQAKGMSDEEMLEMLRAVSKQRQGRIDSDASYVGEVQPQILALNSILTKSSRSRVAERQWRTISEALAAIATWARASDLSLEQALGNNQMEPARRLSRAIMSLRHAAHLERLGVSNSV